MKIQIVNLDPHDDYGSIRDKLLWTKTQRALLVWPGRGEILTNRLDLVLLKRLCQQHSIALGLLTFDPVVRANAKELSIPLFENLENLSEATWAIWEAEPDLPRIDHPHKGLNRPAQPSTGILSPKHPVLRVFILLFPISVFLLALILLLPSAEVLLNPATLREIEIIQFTLSSQPGTSTLELGYDLYEFEIEGERRIPTSGKISIPDQYARGVVQFTNLTDSAITVPAGTSIRSSDFEGQYFRTDREVQLDGNEGTQVLANVTAASAGPDGNLPAETIDSVDGSLGLSLNVTNPEAFAGGSSEIRSAVNASDRQRVQDELELELKLQFFSTLSEQLPRNLQYLKSSYQIDEVLNAQFDAEVGDVADSLQLVLMLQSSVIVIDFNEAQRLAAMRLAPDLPMGYQFAPGSPRGLEIKDEDILEDGDSFVEVVFEVITNREIDEGKIKDSVRGLSLDHASEGLSSQFGNLSPEIRLSPPWWPRLPFFAHQIHVSVDKGSTQ